jgi:hypothetical protein
MSDRRPLGRQENLSAREFLTKLAPPEACTVNAIIDTIRHLSIIYSDEDLQPEAFFAVYGVKGGKFRSRDRQKVKLLITSNAQWFNTYRANDKESEDWIVGTINDTFKNEGYVIASSSVPANRSHGRNKKNIGEVKKITMVPTAGGRNAIDIVVLNQSGLNSLEELETGDADNRKNSIQKVLLYHTTT